MMRLIVLFFSLTNLWVNAHSQQVVSVGFDREQEVNVDRSGIIINITPNAATPSNPFEYLLKAFLQVTVVVKGADDKVLPSYGVKGISTDDAHEVIETLIFNALKFEKPTKSKENFLRDILSSCPNPFSKIRNKCTLKFSPFGEAAVSVYPKSKVALKILVTSTFSPTLLLTLLIGIALLAMANEMSKSKIFQYSVGSIIFVGAGVLVMLLWLSGFFSSSKNKTFVQTAGIAAVLSGTYGASLFWFLGTYLKSLIIDHWEFSLGYVALSAILGIVFIGHIRKNATSKHMMRVGVKWMIRLIGLTCIYNSTASPALGLSFLAMLAFFYVLSSAGKNIHMLFKKFKKGKK